MIEFPDVTPRTIQNHFDMATLFYRWMWGPDLHHGFWESDESPRAAQLQLTRRLAELTAIECSSKVLDVGSGLGNASRWLARNLNCEVTAITNSPIQNRWAATATMFQGCRPKPRFICQDVEQSEFSDETFDVVWSIECTEHLFHKAEFIRRASTWLKPGGRIAICAFLAGANESDENTIQQVQKVFDGMGCPSIATRREYESWLTNAGMKTIESQLWTSNVQKTWEVCALRLNRTWVRWLATPFGDQHQQAIEKLDAILKAYQSGALEYGCFVAEKPA